MSENQTKTELERYSTELRESTHGYDVPDGYVRADLFTLTEAIISLKAEILQIKEKIKFYPLF
jgi:hypothetical protein